MGYFFLGVLIGIACLIWFMRKAARLDFIHYPDRGIDLCPFCRHEYYSAVVEMELRTLERAATTGINLRNDYWDRFCCDALRNRLKAKYGIRAGAHGSK
jgi:hypothetical protein